MVGKVSGPGGGPPVEGPSPDEGAGTPAAGGKRFADALDGARPTSDAAAVPPAGLTADIAADLRAGKIDPKAAVERVIDRILDKQLGADAPAPVREKLRAALETALVDDPLLGEKLKALGG